ncbi:MAG: 2,3-diaminopropionate biosynthesis protein SbnA [Chitinophagaceae bacterium]
MSAIVSSYDTCLQSPLAMRLTGIRKFIGNTPLKQLADEKTELFVKLEYTNYSGSIKDRAVFNILSNAVAQGLVNEKTTIVESSSGNFAISLASMCRTLGLKSIVVIDPNINADYEKALNVLADKVVKVTQRDKTGGFLLTRIETVEEICASKRNVYWTNQYENPNNFMAYYNGLGVEICEEMKTLDYAFIGVSTCGTIAGISKRLKEHYPAVKIIAVDIDGSIIFGHAPKKRHISGLGSSKVPPLLHEAIIDDVVMVSESHIVDGSRDLLTDHAIFGGASAGAMYYAIRHYFDATPLACKPSCLFLCPDKGHAYLDNIYNSDWVHANIDPHFQAKAF